MKMPAKMVAWVLPLLLAGCFFHKTEKLPPQPVAPQIPDPNVPPPAQDPPPVVTIPTKQPVSETKLPVETPKPPTSKHRKQPPPPAPADTTQQASTGTPEVSAIGQLSTGDPGDARSQTETSIAATERGVNGLNRQLSDSEKKTVSHIREFIKQAKAALASGDVDGASTLAAKAKVLLTELVH